MKNGSLRLRLLLAAAFAIAIALFVAGLALTALFEQQVRTRVMQELNNDLLQLAGAIDVLPTGDVKLVRSIADPRFETPYGDKYWRIDRVSSGDAKPLLRSRSYWDSEPTLASNTGPEGEHLVSAERTITVNTGSNEVSLHLQVSTHDDEITSPLSRFRNQLILYLSLIGLALTIAAWLQVSIGLKPLQTLRTQLAALGGSQAQRLTGEFPTEVQPLVSEFNEVLDLRDKSLARARHRAGDLAHGLMTPLTILSTVSRELDDKGLSQQGKEISEQIERMRVHVERGLVRARLSTGRSHEFTSLAENVDAVFATLRKLPKGEQIDWQNAVPPNSEVPIERSDLLELLGNLLDNARKYARKTVAVGFSDRCIVVEDDGPGVKDQDFAAIRQRGRRLDESRQGFGLGLGIVEDIADLYELELTFGRSHLGGFLVKLGIKP
jgi:signal transduction histidine kinase